MRFLTNALVLVAAIVNLLPLLGVLSARRMEALYGITIADGNLELLMRHRAVLFGIVGALLLVAIPHRPLRPAAFTAGLVSMLSFLLIAWLVDDVNAELRRVALVDAVASVALVAAIVLDRLDTGGASAD